MQVPELVPDLLRNNGLDRLAMVSRVLLDTRFLELKTENENLKLSLFWVDHSINRLKKSMCISNNHSAGPRCRCESCVDSKRYEPTILDGYDDEIQDEPCKFKPWFEKALEEHGLSFGEGGATPEEFYSYDREWHPRYYDSVHFNISSDDVWNEWVYGAKLWHARSIRDPELLKLRALFKSLLEYHPEEGFYNVTYEWD